MLRLFTLELGAVIRANSLRRMLDLGAYFCYIVESLGAAQPVIFLGTSVNFDIPGAVISESKKILFAPESYGRYWPDKVSVDKLVRVFRLFLRYTILDLDSFSLLATIVYKVLRVIKIGNL